MPIYEYQCKSCGHQFDEIQKHDAEPLTDCPDCRAPSLVKLMSAPSFRLKGQGWYETDFKKSNQRNLAGDKSASSEGKSKNAADSKPTDTKSDKSTSGGDSKTSAASDHKTTPKKAAGGD